VNKSLLRVPELAPDAHYLAANQAPGR
jgi:hypothetical protein